MEQQTTTNGIPIVAWGVIGLAAVLALAALIAFMYGVDVSDIIRS